MYLMSAITLPTLMGCSSLLKNNEGIFGKSSKNTAAAASDIRDINTKLAETDQTRLTHIGAWSKGVEYSLDKSTNRNEPAISTAKTINTRVEELANKPEMEELKQVYKIVDSFLTNTVEGQKLLNKKDKEIIHLEDTITELNQEKQDAIKIYTQIAEANAAKADQYKTTIQQLDGNWGINAMWYGIKKFFSRIALTLGILTVLFIILRILATTNPIAASIFAIFNQIGSWLINMLKGIFPKAASISGLVPHTDFQGYKTTLTKIVDAIEVVKSKEATLKTTNPTQCISISDLSTEIAKSFDSADTARVDDTKKSLLWKL